MERKKICCCGSSGWTRVIGWFQVVLSIIYTIIIAVALAFAAAARARADEANKSGGTPLTTEEMNSPKTPLLGVIVSSLIALVFSALSMSIVMAIVLLRGSYTRNTRFIHYWMVYTVIGLVISTISTIAQIFVKPTGDTIASPIIFLVFGLAIQVFCLWVVGTHKKEIEASAAPVIPAKA